MKILIKTIKFIIFFFSVRRMPFDIDTSVGYGLALATEFIGMLSIGSILCLVNSFIFSVCWYIEACLSDLESMLLKINMVLNKPQLEKIKMHLLLRQFLIEFVKFHNQIIS